MLLFLLHTTVASISYNATLTVIWGFTPLAGQQYTILTCGSRVGQFTTVTIPPITGLNFNVIYNPTNVIINVQGPALPIDLINFNAKLNDNKAELNWQTASEVNVKNFYIEKSSDGKTFSKIRRNQSQ